MRNLILTFSLLFAFSAAHATTYAVGGGENIPETVKQAFKKDHPNATDIDWEKDDENFEVEYMEDGVEKESTYSADGREIETKVDIEGEELPEEAHRDVKANYADWEMEDVDEMKRDGETFYEVELEHADGREMEIIYDQKGAVISKKEEETKKRKK